MKEKEAKALAKENVVEESGVEFVVVAFVRDHPPYGIGDVARFTRDEARELFALEVALPHKPGSPDPEKPVRQTMIGDRSVRTAAVT
jgi:hypothetical protein